MAAKKKQPDPSKPLPYNRHEAFAQALAKGASNPDAYAEAGFVRDRRDAHRLAKRPHMLARVAWLKNKAAERTITTVEDIARQLDEDRSFARNKEQASAAVSATMGKAKVLGLIVDRHVVGMKRVEDMNEHELRAMLGLLGEARGDRG